MRSPFGALFPDEDDVEGRCMLAFSLWIGNHFIAPTTALAVART